MRLTTETFARRRTPMPRPMSKPMPLPMLPELKKEEQERRRGAVAFPSALPGAPAPVAVVGVVSGSPYVWLAKALARSIPAGGLKAMASAALVVGLGLGLGFGSAALFAEPDYAAASAAYIPHPAPVGAAAEPIRTAAVPPSSVTLVREERAPAAPAAAAAAAASVEPAPAPADAEPAAGPAPAEATAEPLRDSVGPLKPRRAARGGERLAWGGQTIKAAAPQGGEFLPMKAPRAAAAAQAVSGRRAGKTASLRRVANLKLGSSRVQPGSANRAMGQLKLASRLSSSSAQASGVEAAKQGGGDAFEQSKSVGGEGLSLDAVPSTGLGGSAPDVTETAPALPPGENKTPYQDKVDSAQKKNAMTRVLLILGALLAAAGLALVLLADTLSAEPETQAILKNIGYALIGAGAAMVLAGFLMAQQAKKDAKDVGDQYGQKEQGAVIEDCADQALGKADCAPKAVEQPGNTVHEAVEAESKAGYTLGAEGAQGGK